MSDNMQRLLASIRESNRSMAKLLLTEAKAAQAFLELAATVKDDGDWRERFIQSAFEALKRIDASMLKLDIDGDQQEQIITARSALAARLRQFGQQFPNEK